MLEDERVMLHSNAGPDTSASREGSSAISRSSVLGIMDWGGALSWASAGVSARSCMGCKSHQHD